MENETFQIASLLLRDAMTVEEFLSAACLKKGLNPVENFVRVKKRRDMSANKYFVPHRSDLIETYVSGWIHNKKTSKNLSDINGPEKLVFFFASASNS